MFEKHIKENITKTLEQLNKSVEDILKKSMKDSLKTLLKSFDGLPKDERYREFARLTTAQLCLDRIVKYVKDTGNIKDFCDKQEDFINETLGACSVYMSAGIDFGYTTKHVE